MDGIENPSPMPDFQPETEIPIQYNIFSKMQYFMPEMIQPINETLEESYLQKYNTNQIQDPIPLEPNKKNIVFKTTFNARTNIVADFEQTMSDVILLYLKKVGKEMLLKRSSDIFFLYNAQIIDIFDETKVKDFFKNKSNPIIIFNERNNIGA